VLNAQYTKLWRGADSKVLVWRRCRGGWSFAMTMCFSRPIRSWRSRATCASLEPLMTGMLGCWRMITCTYIWPAIIHHNTWRQWRIWGGGGRAGSAPPHPLGDALAPHSQYSWYLSTVLYYGDTVVMLANAKFWSFYCKTWCSEYSKWLPPASFWQL